MPQSFRELLDSALVRTGTLARATGVSREFVRLVATGQREPGPETLAAWAKALRVPQKRLRAAIAETRRRAGR